MTMRKGYLVLIWVLVSRIFRAARLVLLGRLLTITSLRRAVFKDKMINDFTH